MFCEYIHPPNCMDSPLWWKIWKFVWMLFLIAQEKHSDALKAMPKKCWLFTNYVFLRKKSVKKIQKIQNGKQWSLLEVFFFFFFLTVHCKDPIYLIFLQSVHWDASFALSKQLSDHFFLLFNHAKIMYWLIFLRGKISLHSRGGFVDLKRLKKGAWKDPVSIFFLYIFLNIS